MKTIKQLEKEIEELYEKCCINIHSCSPTNKCEPCEKRFVYIKGKIEQTKAIKKMIEEDLPILWNKYLRGDISVSVWGKVTKEILSKIEGEEE